MMLGDSQGMVKCAIATCGLPRGLSHETSKALHMSAPKKGRRGASPGGGGAMPSACRCGARDSGNSSEGS